MVENNLSLGDRFVLIVLIFLYSFNLIIHAYFIALVAGFFTYDWVLLAYWSFFGYVILYALLILIFNAVKKVNGVVFENYMFLLPIHFFFALWLNRPLLILLGILSVFGIIISMLSIRLLYKSLN